MRRWTARGLAAALVLVCLGACGTSADRAQQAALAALTVAPARSQAAAATPSVTCRYPTASLRPPAALPAPGAMPGRSTMAAIVRRGYLIAGVDQNTLLLSYFNPIDDRLEGFEIDMLREIARAIFGRPDAIQFRAVTTAERISAVRDGSVDLVADAMTITCERRRQVAFSTVYFDAGQRALVPSNSRARSIGDLAGRRVCATAGSTSIEALEHSYPGVRPYPVAQRTDCLIALQQGLVAAITSDDAILLGFRGQDPYTRIIGPRFADEPYGIAIAPQHRDLVRFVNGVLDRMRHDGRWRAIYARWLGPEATTVPAPPTPRYEG
jgi:polar amino acid transport system substrate-binding protein